MFFSILSGILTSLALPMVFGGYRLPHLGWLAWFSLVPLYISFSQLPQKSFLKGFLFGVVYYGLSLYWIFIAMHTYGEVSFWGSFAGVALVVLILSSFSGVLFGLAVYGHQRLNLPLFLMIPLGGTILEWMRNYFPFGGFPWASIGYTQSSFISLLQILDATGIYGIIFLLLLSNSIIGEFFLSGFFKKRPWPARPLTLFLLIFGGSLIYGSWRLWEIQKIIPLLPTMKISIVQGNVPQDEKWLEEKVEPILHQYVQMSLEAQNQGAEMIVWPEAAYPLAIPPDKKEFLLLSDLKVPLLMGAVTYEGEIPEEWPPQPDEENFALHNSAVLLLPGGEIGGQYHKNHLVPMGEYVPLGEWLFFLQKIVPSISSFSPGYSLNLLGEPPVQFGTTICYEDLFPQMSRIFVKEGADFLVNLTNDAWYEHSSALFQHFDFSRYRAIENRRAMVRATNTGVTAFFSPTGEVISEAPIFKKTILNGEISLGGPLTFYTRYGDVFVGACAGGLFLLVLSGILKIRLKKHLSEGGIP